LRSREFSQSGAGIYPHGERSVIVRKQILRLFDRGARRLTSYRQRDSAGVTIEVAQRAGIDAN
jgi:hypothetical protein